ncbi:MAG: Hsp20/alpha crystallin family protein [Verrucomicrobiales bacterium]|nr:Hsp20/alpha crystallin family protein [Verrucomicrobiales bacterium]
MSITQWNPFRDLFASRMLNLPDLFREDAPQRPWVPSVDVTENDQEYLVKAEIPDVKNEDVKVTVRDGILTIKGERKFEKKTDNEKVHVLERSFGSFSRTFSLPKDADADRVKAEFKNGLLNVSIPKRAEVKPKEVEVQVG